MNDIDFLVKKMNEFDFTYVFSDDHNVYKRCAADEISLKTLIEKNVDELKQRDDLSEKARGYFNI